MAKVLPDRDIRRLLGTVLLQADEQYINPNGIELRLGKYVRFHSSSEEKELSPGSFLKVNPGETVTISSHEEIDFRAETVRTLFPDQMLMGLITPTTTMMREGISQVATKVDAGFKGYLNWGLRNGSTKELLLRYAEPIFKLTVFLLEQDETPEIPYGARDTDSYQDSQGIMRSARQIQADIPKDRVVSSSVDRVDPKKQLREAGYPFDHIGTELTTLHGKFEVVSKDVMLLKGEFDKRTVELGGKIEQETARLVDKLEDSRKNILERVEALFDRKFLRVMGVLIGAIPILYGGVTFLKGTTLGGQGVALIAVGLGMVIFLITYLITRRTG